MKQILKYILLTVFFYRENKRLKSANNYLSKKSKILVEDIKDLSLQVRELEADRNYWIDYCKELENERLFKK